MLCSRSNQNEILWNFSRFKDERRLTLKQNPHFYEVLPTSPKDYGDKFRTRPTETYLEKGRISVLTDKLGQAGRVFLKTAKTTRAFGNVWDLKDAIIFKGSWHFFCPFSHLSDISQTSLDSLREKASLVQTSKTPPTYGVLRNLHRLPPPDRRLH